MTTWRGRPDENAQVTWLIDGKPVAEGLDAFVTAPAPGEYRVQLTVRGQDGQTSCETQLVVAGGPDNSDGGAFLA